MLATKSSAATVAVRDLAAARDFYERVLGLPIAHIEGEDALNFKTGDSMLLVYKSDYAGTNQATAVTWEIGSEIDAIVSSLKEKGVTFEHYDMLDARREGDLHVIGRMRVAWFKDPDGNIHGLIGT